MDSTVDREARLDEHILILGSMAVALYGLAMVLVVAAFRPMLRRIPAPDPRQLTQT